MKTLIFIHGADSFLDDEAYIRFLQNDYIPRYTMPWDDVEKVDYRKDIAKKWKEQGGQVWYPAMPNKQNARYRDWKLVFEGILTQLHPDDELTLVGGSLGGCFLLKYFADTSVIPGLTRDPDFDSHFFQITGFLLSPRGHSLELSSNSPSSQEGQKQFQVHQIHLVAACIAEGDFTAPTNYDFLKSLGNRIHIWHAEDDRVVPFTVGEELSSILPDAIFHPFAPDRGYGHFHGIPAFPELEESIIGNTIDR